MSTDAADNDRKPRDYGPPFDDSDADVVLRSSDVVDFYVYKPILAKSSRVFRDMFSVPQPARDATGPRNLPIIPLSETATDLVMVLTFCCPLQRPALTFQDALIVLRIAEKYAMEWLCNEVKCLMKQPAMAREHPIKVFALAWDMKLEDVARVAAKEFLRVELTLDGLLAEEEIEYLSGSALRQLALYHRKCSDIAQRQCTSGELSWTKGQCKSLGWIHSKNCSCLGHTYIISGSKVVVTTWCDSFLKGAQRTLSKQPWPPIVQSVDLAGAAHLSASQCGPCRGSITSALQEYSQALAEHLERCISEVSVDLRRSGYRWALSEL